MIEYGQLCFGQMNRWGAELLDVEDSDEIDRVREYKMSSESVMEGVGT